MKDPNKLEESQATRDERVGALAYEIWEREGCPDGKHEEHWHLASSIIDARDSGASPDYLPPWLARSEIDLREKTTKQSEKVVPHIRHRSAA